MEYNTVGVQKYIFQATVSLKTRQMLKEDTIIDGIRFRKNSSVDFDERGKLAGGRIANDIIIDGVKLSKDAIILFKNGRISSAMGVGEKDKIQYSGLMCFNNNGVFTGGELKNNTVFSGVLWKSGTDIRFNEKGILKSVEPVEDTVIDKVKYKQNEWVEYFDNGKVLWGMISGDQLIKGLWLKDSSSVSYYENGLVKEATLLLEIPDIKELYCRLQQRLRTMKAGW